MMEMGREIEVLMISTPEGDIIVDDGRRGYRSEDTRNFPFCNMGDTVGRYGRGGYTS